MNGKTGDSFLPRLLLHGVLGGTKQTERPRPHFKDVMKCKLKIPTTTPSPGQVSPEPVATRGRLHAGCFYDTEANQEGLQQNHLRRHKCG